MLKETKYLLALSNAPGLGPIRVKTLLHHFKNPIAVWNISKEDVYKVFGEKLGRDFLKYKKNTDVEALVNKVEGGNVRLLTILDKDYPKLLKEIHDPPVVLYYRGEILPKDELSIAVVGSRKMTDYGQEVTKSLVRDLVKVSLTIVSGLAYGVDAISHQSALEEGGRTIAVLGSGLNRIYPSSHQKLAEEIWSGHGAVLSEFLPDEGPRPENFPLRNRIISGLSLGVLVTEAASDSGSLITANCALEQGREVFAVPGPIYSRLSKGPSELIKQGAKLVLGAQDILEELNLEMFKGVVLKETTNSKEEEQLLALLLDGPRYADELVRQSGLEVSKTNSLLSLLELKGLIRNVGGNQYIKVNF